MAFRRPNDFVHMFMNELSCRVVSESGRPTDRYHLGKILLRSLKDAPDFILQIDGSTNVSETFSSVLKRSIRCAIGFKNLGLKLGDVIVLMAPNHLDLAIPMYAALYLGVIIAAVDKAATVNELKDVFEVDKPKVVFCQSEKASDIKLALNYLQMDTQVITFDKGDSFCSFTDFLNKYGNDSPVEEFAPTDFDPAETISFLVATSGSTGLPKAAVVSHKNMTIAGPYWQARCYNFPTPFKMVLVGSQLQWLTAIYQYVFSPILRYTRLQSTLPLTRDHAHHLINTYRPNQIVLSPTLMAAIIKGPERKKCDFTCFDLIMLGGSAVSREIIEELKALTPDTEVFNVYGASEITGYGFHPDSLPAGSCGQPMGCFQYRLINIDTQEDITEPNKQGELWIRGPSVVKGYYRNPEATKEAFAEGGWFKTGDIFYRDEYWNFFFVERYKLLLKYMNNQISPVEVENVIRQNPDVLDVAVTGIPDSDCGELVVAFVVRRPGSNVTAQDIKNLVKDTLADSKQLRGGVIFLEEMPMTASSKIHRRKLKEIALEMKRE